MLVFAAAVMVWRAWFLVGFLGADSPSGAVGTMKICMNAISPLSSLNL